MPSDQCGQIYPKMYQKHLDVKWHNIPEGKKISIKKRCLWEEITEFEMNWMKSTHARMIWLGVKKQQQQKNPPQAKWG